MDQETVREFYTWASLGTLTVSVGAVIMVSNTFRKLLGYDTPFIPFLVSMALVIAGAFRSGQVEDVYDILLAFFNSCLLFCTATGGNDLVLTARPRPEGKPQPYGRRKVRFFSPWIIVRSDE